MNLSHQIRPLNKTCETIFTKHLCHRSQVSYVVSVVGGITLCAKGAKQKE